MMKTMFGLAEVLLGGAEIGICDWPATIDATHTGKRLGKGANRMFS